MYGLRHEIHRGEGEKVVVQFDVHLVDKIRWPRSGAMKLWRLRAEILMTWQHEERDIASCIDKKS